MRLPSSLIARLVGLCLGAAWPSEWSAAAGEMVPATAEVLRDFMIQNVCLDLAGGVLPGRSPLDGVAACPRQRDLLPSERLPYHKHDHPSPAERGPAPAGYQRHDSFPIEISAFGTLVEHSFDFGAGGERRFGVFDRGSDGGDIVVLSPGMAAIGATEDGGAGFQLFVGECDGNVTPMALAHAWIVAEFDPSRPAPLEGETIARLKDLKPGEQDRCPARFSRAYTRWRVAPFAYRSAPGQGRPVMLTTLVSEHFGGADPATADHVERFYFTRELGGTRWERWQNASGTRRYGAALIAERAAGFAATGRCASAEPPAGGATMLLIDCREWTLITPPVKAPGDRPGFFLDAVRERPETPAFFKQ